MRLGFAPQRSLDSDGEHVFSTHPWGGVLVPYIETATCCVLVGSSLTCLLSRACPHFLYQEPVDHCRYANPKRAVPPYLRRIRLQQQPAASLRLHSPFVLRERQDSIRTAMKSWRTGKSLLCGALLSGHFASAIDLVIGDPNSIKSAALTVAKGMLNYYAGDEPGNTPGLLPEPYYWWEAGAMFGALIDYWYYTGDDQFNDMTSVALQFQVGPHDNYMPPNQTKSLGNDDQGFWSLAAMSAAEVKFPNPPADKPQWLALAQGVFNSQAERWDLLTCSGGLRWQVFQFNKGWNYKNSISNGIFFNLGARLGAYTQNESYFQWAEKTWDWSESIGLLNYTGDGMAVYDGSDTEIDCADVNHKLWSYNSGVYLLGAAVMWNQDGIMVEDCEESVGCNTDQLSFKAYLSRWMAASIKVAPFVEPMFTPQLQTSAVAAAKSCSGGTDGVTCGTRWNVNAFDGLIGVGQQMCALEVIQGMLIDTAIGPVTNFTGGISVGDPSAGSGDDNVAIRPLRPITTADRAGAGILTAMILSGWLGCAYWMIS
nr:mannan endo-1,6-alpha-mannosidase dcw1 [Quercus suber]